jgi:phage gpG-like protein
MSVTIKIELPPESQELIKRFQDMPAEFPKTVKRGMDRALSVVRGRIQEKRLSGKGPYPPSQHQLGIKTQQLQRSLRAEPAVIAGNTVTGAIGTPVVYGAVHEFGFSGTVRGRGGASRKMEMPERAPVRTGISENAEYIAGEIGKEIGDAFKKT